MKKQRLKIYRNSAIFFCSLMLLFFSFYFAWAADQKTAAQPEVQLQVPIFSYTKATDIAEYIKNLYQYALYALVPLSIIIIIYAGIRWIIAGGNQAQIKEAKKYISAAITGLIIGLLSYVILDFIGITKLTVPGIEYIETGETPDLWVNVSESFKFNAPQVQGAPGAPNVLPGGLVCPKSGGRAAIPQIAAASAGKITYRLGAKISGGGDAPCPSGTLCLDCSGYAFYLFECAGIRTGMNRGTSTAGIFGCNCSKSKKVDSFTDTSINNIPLQPGDMVGMPSGCSDVGMKIGHVEIYAGNGRLTECHGGPGREFGKCIGQPTITYFFTKDPNHSIARYKCVRRLE